MSIYLPSLSWEQAVARAIIDNKSAGYKRARVEYCTEHNRYEVVWVF